MARRCGVSLSLTVERQADRQCHVVLAGDQHQSNRLSVQVFWVVLVDTGPQAQDRSGPLLAQEPEKFSGSNRFHPTHVVILIGAPDGNGDAYQAIRSV